MDVFQSTIQDVFANINQSQYWPERETFRVKLEWVLRTLFSCLPCVDSVTQVCAQRTFDEIARSYAPDKQETPLIRSIRRDAAHLTEDLAFLNVLGASKAHDAFMTFFTGRLGLVFGRQDPAPSPFLPADPPPPPAAAAADAPPPFAPLPPSTAPPPAAAAADADDADAPPPLAPLTLSTAPPPAAADAPPPFAPLTLFDALSPINREDQQALREMIHELATTPTMTLFKNEEASKAAGKQTMEERGDAIGGRIHPLRFLEFLLNDDELRKDLALMSNNTLIWRGVPFKPGFMPGFKARLTKWVLQGGPRFEEYLPGFAGALHVSEKKVKEFILLQPSKGWLSLATKGDNWSDLINWVIEQKRAGGAGRA